jgi:Raf kinase inhibitor-like YbhB/YbcL family protein
MQALICALLVSIIPLLSNFAYEQQESFLHSSKSAGHIVAIHEKGFTMKNKKELQLQAQFTDGDYMPLETTCEGGDQSPALAWHAYPDAQSYVLIVDDPDAPRIFLKPEEDAFVHWVLFNIPPAITQLSKNVDIQTLAQNYIKIGINSSGQQKYMGPCPPPGNPHHYRFKLYALDKMLSAPSGSTKNQILEAMQGHILAQAEIVGLYRRHFGTSEK